MEDGIPGMKKHLYIKISGPRVQGIGFRWSAYEKFVELELQGKAENSADGSITINAEGPEEVLAQLVEWCHQGPMGAKISKVETAEPAEPFAAKNVKS